MSGVQVLAKRSRESTSAKWGNDLGTRGQSRNEHVIDAMNRDLLSMSKEYDNRHFRDKYRKVSAHAVPSRRAPCCWHLHVLLLLRIDSSATCCSATDLGPLQAAPTAFLTSLPPQFCIVVYHTNHHRALTRTSRGTGNLRGSFWANAWTQTMKWVWMVRLCSSIRTLKS